MIRITFYIRIFFVVIIFLAGCSQKDDELTQLQHTLTKVQSLLEAHEPSKVLQYLDRGFIAQGRYQANQIGQMMALHFQQNRQIYIFLKNTKIQLRDAEADVVSTAYLLGSKNIIPERGQRYEVKMRWLKVKGQWKLSRLNWQREAATKSFTSEFYAVISLRLI